MNERNGPIEEEEVEKTESIELPIESKTGKETIPRLLAIDQ